MTNLNPTERAKLLVTRESANPMADGTAMIDYARALIVGTHDVDQLQTLVEATNHRELMQRFGQVPGADQQRLAGSLAVLDVMES